MYREEYTTGIIRLTADLKQSPVYPRKTTVAAESENAFKLNNGGGCVFELLG